MGRRIFVASCNTVERWSPAFLSRKKTCLTRRAKWRGRRTWFAPSNFCQFWQLHLCHRLRSDGATYRWRRQKLKQRFLINRKKTFFLVHSISYVCRSVAFLPKIASNASQEPFLGTHPHTCEEYEAWRYSDVKWTLCLKMYFWTNSLKQCLVDYFWRFFYPFWSKIDIFKMQCYIFKHIEVFWTIVANITYIII
jgi:hypothetical protein